jgi:hypothetical protein
MIELVGNKVFICNIYAVVEVAALGIVSESFGTNRHGKIGSMGENIVLGCYYSYHFAQENVRSC